jgi:hypothetical protein
MALHTHPSRRTIAAAAGQVKDLLLTRCDPGLPGAGVGTQLIRQEFGYRVRVP